MLWRIAFIFFSLFIALWKATQHVAAAVKYDALLGAPLMIDRGVPVYGPWKYPIWFFKIRQYIPKTFADTYMYFLIAIFASG